MAKAPANPAQEHDPAQLKAALEAVRSAARIDRASRAFEGLRWKPVIGAVEKLAKKGRLPEELIGALRAWQAAASPRDLTAEEREKLRLAEVVINDEGTPWGKFDAAFKVWERCKRVTTPLKEERALLDRLDALIRGGAPTPKPAESNIPVIPATDAVGLALMSDLNGLAGTRRAAWLALIRHALGLSATKPTQKWSAAAREFVQAVDNRDFAERLREWFACCGKPSPVRRPGFMREAMEPTLLNDASADLLKGLAWSVAAAGRVELAPALGALAESCFVKVPNHGKRNERVGNAAAAALAALARPEAGAELARLRTRVKHQSSRAAVDKAIGSLSESTGLSADDLAEMAVPLFGLDATVTGTRREQLGACAAELRVRGARSVALEWFGPGGKPVKAVPASVKADHAAALKRLRREAKDASAMLAASAVRIERLYLKDRSWPLTTWRERYLDHPLVGTLARRLIWVVGDTSVVCRDGRRFVDSAGRTVRPRAGDVVRLWHPMTARPEQVLAWRQWLGASGVVQPFKQAHREVYALTDAERQTRTYSNRFAAHVLRQHQLAALAQQRGWDYRLQGQFDSFNSPKLALPQHGLTAEFWVEPAEGDGMVSPAGINLYVTTDQVRFGRPLAEVPAIVFSEVMRDVDLFVGVCSVGNDPDWQPGDARGPYGDYWREFSFGELGASAQTRREVLAALLPRLTKIRDRATLSDRFLVVRGDLRTYKIHLGSGNILMEPIDQYLCIVPGRPDVEDALNTRLFLPFEGDTTLSVILSKAFLLADDTAIKDQSIVRQIKP